MAVGVLLRILFGAIEGDFRVPAIVASGPAHLSWFRHMVHVNLNIENEGLRKGCKGCFEYGLF